MTYAGKQDLKFSENNNFAASFMHLILRWGYKEDWRNQGEDWLKR